MDLRNRMEAKCVQYFQKLAFVLVIHVSGIRQSMPKKWSFSSRIILPWISPIGAI